MNEERIVRCQAAIMHEGKILLVKHLNHTTGNVYWWFPGGGLKPGETKEACVVREVKEETGLVVKIERLLFEQQGDERHTYQLFATYHCTIVSGNPCAGREESQNISVLGFTWYALRDESDGDPGLYEEYVYPVLKKIRTMIP